MKGKDLIKFVQENNLEEFEFQFTFVDGFEGGFPNRRTFKIEEQADIGYSDKIVSFDGEEN